MSIERLLLKFKNVLSPSQIENIFKDFSLLPKILKNASIFILLSDWTDAEEQAEEWGDGDTMKWKTTLFACGVFSFRGN